MSTKAKTESKAKTETKAVDVAKIEQPEAKTLNDQLIIELVQEMVQARAKENPKHPHVGVNEVALALQEQHDLTVDGKDVRRRLQKIRKAAPDYKSGQQTGQVTLPADSNRNPSQGALTIMWVNSSDRTKGIEYVITPAGK